MGFLNNFKEGLRNRMKSFLQIQEAQPIMFNIMQGLDEESRTIKNSIWYRGDTFELEQLYKQMPNKQDTFWGAVPTNGLEIRKIHTGMPSLIVDVLTTIVISDYNGITFAKDNINDEDFWKEVEKENKFNNLLKDSVTSALSIGRGAFKISFDKDISNLPILEYYPKDKLEIVEKRGRTRELVFKNIYFQNSKKYVLKETYGYGYIKYRLYHNDNEVNINTIPQTNGLEDIIFDNSFMLAQLFEINRDSIYDKKTDNFDALDEAWSQWMNALRDGRTKTYIPTSLIPRNPENGELLRPNPFDNKFIKTEDDMSETGKNQIKTESPTIQTDSYMSTYITALDLALEGIISPSTLGIDTKKLTDPNATAQREKEKTTLYTRGKIVEAINNTIPALVDKVFKFNNTYNKKPIADIDVSVEFGEYANPSFEAQVETVGKAKTGGIMSIERCVEELYGDSMTDEEKQEEIARLKAEQGIIETEEYTPTQTIPTVPNKVV